MTTSSSPMELPPVYEFSESEGRLRMNFSASLLRHEAAAFFHIRTFETGRDTDHDAFGYDTARFLSCPPSQRDSLISDMMSGHAILHDDAACLFWGDLVASLVEAAVAELASLSHGFLQTVRGIRFNVDFYVDAVPSSAGDADVCSGVELERLNYDSSRFKERDCAICFEEYASDGKDLTEMPCLHSFHYDCVAKWLKISRSCPLCRQHVH